MTSEEHGTSYISTARGDRGKRTVWYGYCKCGKGTTTSASASSVEKKIAAHAKGDDRGMYRRSS
jgi:hypothetical protein